MINNLFGSKTDKAILRIQEFEKQALALSLDGYYIAFSGGKDSVVLLDLVKKSGVKHTAYYNLTTVDPPELVYFIREHYPDIITTKPKRSMWDLIRYNMILPTRIARYCCKELKERGGEGRFVLTGIRWQESIRRRNRGMVESCNKSKFKRYMHPIIDWQTEDIWEYIRSNKLPYCSLYDEGWKRIGCIGCPMGGTNKMMRDFIRWPKYHAAYKRAADFITKKRKGEDPNFPYKDGESLMRWWMQTDKNETILDGGLFDIETEE